MPLLTDGSCELFAEWDLHGDEILIKSDMSVSGYGLLRGTFSHSLPVTISDWTIMHGNRVYRTRKNSADGALSAGTIWDAGDPDTYASDLKSYLNVSRLVKDESDKAGNRGTTQVITPYDADSKDPVYVLTMATFYQVAGGAKYVGLSNSILNQVELSDTIRMNHAVLIGVADKPATNLSLGSTKLHANDSKTIVRLLIPIDRRPSKRLAPKQE